MNKDMFKRIFATFTVWLMLAPSQAWSDWAVSGYASIGAGRLQDKNMEFQDYTSDEWNFEGDSALGLQLNLNLAERLSLTAQVVSRGHHWDDTEPFEPELDWLFLSYQLNDHWRTRFGRMRTPLFFYSETIDVGYSYVWARPPTDVYAPVTLPFSNFDGADLFYVSTLGEFDMDVQLLAGTMERSRDTVEITVEPLIGGNLSLHSDDVTLRYGLLMMNTSIQIYQFEELSTLFYLAADLIDPMFTEIPRQFEANNNWYRFQSLAMRWKPGNFTAIGEAFDIRNIDDGYTNDTRGWYLSLQYSLDQVTPYIVAGWHKNKFAAGTLELLEETYNIWPEGQIVPFAQEQVNLLDSTRALIVREIEANSFEQRTWTLGLRYDIHSNVALKAEWQYFDFASGSSQIVVRSPDHPDHTSMTTFILDVVF